MDLEIRLHGRGGQGGVTCAKILASLYAGLGKSVQSFGDYAGERSGAPVRAYTRAGDGTIANRNKVYEPDHVIVLDPTLLGHEAVGGLRVGGLLLVNTKEPAAALQCRFPAYRVAVIDATAVARRHGIGSRSLVIVNTTIAGAFVRAMGLPFATLEDVYRRLGLAGNLAAAREAYDLVTMGEPTPAGVPISGNGGYAATPAPRPPVPEIAAHVLASPPPIHTGSWRTQRPRYTERLAPCNAFCPAGNDVVGFVQALAREGEAAAARVLSRTQPFASICGRVCPAPCMEGCNRSEHDGAVNIRGLERWIGDRTPPGGVEPWRAARQLRVAVVGGGPAGLSAAYAITLAGHRAAVFERGERLGGVLATGIPAYRLPRAVVEREIGAVLDLGVTAHLGERLDRQDVVLLARDFDAVIVATGLQRLGPFAGTGAGAGAKGHANVEQGIDFLDRLNAGGPVHLGGHVVVLGGGNTAMDCARSALRLGAQRVTVAYRRGRDEMPAIREEVAEAVAEGVELRLLRQPVGLAGDGRATSIELDVVELGEQDASGRRRPVATGRRETLACDHVLLALGQSADRGLLPEGAEVHEGRVRVAGKETTIFVAGDVATGEGTVTHAIGDGRRAAGRALAALGEPVLPFTRPDRKLAVALSAIRLDHFPRRPPGRELRREERGRARGPASFAEVNLGLPSAAEALRCFSCGHCTRCDTCLVFCPEGVIRRHDGGYEVDYGDCKGCGICVNECPREAMEMVPECRVS